MDDDATNLQSRRVCDLADRQMTSHDPSDQGPPPAAPGDRSITHGVHDLKNLLTIMAGCVESLAGRLTEVRQLADLADLQRALSRAFLLATDLLGSDTSLLKERPAININHAIVDVEGIVRRMLGPGIVCALSLAPKAPFVFAHPLDIERILFNLILNARDAMGEKGTVTIETAILTPDPGGEAGLVLVRRAVRLTITDTGPGIAPGVGTDWPAPTSLEKRPGRGFGLASVSELVQRLNGRMQIDSQPGVGTRIAVDLPLA
jgi:two-component system, cell cycle sensor histidine kinase and response regulator CckA